MYLLKCTTPVFEIIYVYHSRNRAIAKGTEFVDEHNEIDGLSTKPITHMNEMNWSRWRNTSFGQRKAEIVEIGFADEGLDPLPD